MRDALVIEGITFQGYCGVSLTERQTPQPIMVDLELECSHAEAISQDDITQTVDYAEVVSSVVHFGTKNEFALVETLADSLVHQLFNEYPIAQVKIWVRKVAPPLDFVKGTVGVRLTKPRPAMFSSHVSSSISAPAQFLVDSLHRLPKGKALDVAAGSGRNALYLANHGHSVICFDRDEAALSTLNTVAREKRLSQLSTQIMDLETHPTSPPVLGNEEFDVVLVFFYLFRPLFSRLLQALKPGGVLMYETFLIDNHHLYQHPRRKEFCLAHNELLERCKGLRILHYDEAPHPTIHNGESAITARLLAQKAIPN